MEKLFIKTGHGMETVGVNLPYFCVKDEGIGKQYCAITDKRNNLKVMLYNDGTASLFQMNADEVSSYHEPISLDAFAAAYTSAIERVTEKFNRTVFA